MAYRLAFKKCINPFSKSLRNPFKSYSSSCCSKKGNKPNYDFRIMPFNRFLEPVSLFNPKNILKHYEVIPIIAIVGIGVVLLYAHNIRTILTRDDVRFTTKSLFNCEIVEMDREKKPWVRKAMVFNQKYETPEGLIKALEEPSEEELAKMEEEKKKQKK